STALMVCSCGDGRKQCFPASGEIYVDGKPAPDAIITLFPVDGSDPKSVRPFGMADETGAFRISSYVQGDGAPAGEYIVTLEWRERSGLLKNNFEGPDRLKGKYADRTKSTLRVTIEKKSNDLGRYDLKTK